MESLEAVITVMCLALVPSTQLALSGHYLGGGIEAYCESGPVHNSGQKEGKQGCP